MVRNGICFRAYRIGLRPSQIIINDIGEMPLRRQLKSITFTNNDKHQLWTTITRDDNGEHRTTRATQELEWGPTRWGETEPLFVNIHTNKNLVICHSEALRRFCGNHFGRLRYTEYHCHSLHCDGRSRSPILSSFFDRSSLRNASR